MIRTSTKVAAVAAAAMLLLGCQFNDGANPVPSAAQRAAPASAAPSASGPAIGTATTQPPVDAGPPVSYDLVKQLALQYLPRFEQCPVVNTSDLDNWVDPKYRPAATTIHNFDCYDKVDDTTPHYFGWTIYVKFRTREQAAVYAYDMAQAYRVMLAGDSVVMTHGDKDLSTALITAIRTGCSCGTALGT
jgi:hypothetical protein